MLLNKIIHRLNGFNEKLETSPEVVNEDPYGEGWMIRVKISDVAQFDELLSADDYKNLIA